ncbi:hypothetical protein PAXRUDRAFT_18607 [Paxillus rubicundulus Ve08.2h10]|uniref:Zn(2)-C6 fungal-type domain-containing protein n=1 Tax=Paxillus rubicundulus Ve08.2h10 TaxID=930991 RepID=A0A0D0D6T2_9AGAM|nr:hypothetical protein PAXRUDRAFT_18607 [Paxillus rubicundulus Ve08.2h10]
MDATSANNVLHATVKTIVDLLCGEVQDGEWAIAVGRMYNAMHATRAIIQHADMIPGIIIAVEQLLYLEAAQGTIIQTDYEFGDSSTNDNEVSQPLNEPMGAEEEEAQGVQILQMKIKEDDEEDVDDGHANPAPPSTPPCMLIPVPNPTQQRQGHQGCRRGALQPLAAPQPTNACLTCVDFGILCEPNPGYSCFTCRSRKKKCEQSGMTRGQSASRACQPMQSRSVDALSQQGTPARSRAPSEAPAARSRCPSRAASSKRGTPVNTQPPTNPQDHPNMASRSMGIILHIPPSRATSVATIRMESAPKTSTVKAPVNMGLIAGTTYSLGGNPLVSHEEHHAALQQLETVEVENHKLHWLITRALDHIKVLEQGMALLDRICEVTQHSVATSPTDFDKANMGFPFKQERSTVALHQELGPAQCSHSPSPSLSSNTIDIPSAVNLGMRWHIGPAIVQSTTLISPSVSPWMSSDTCRSRSMPATGTIYSGPQMSSANDTPIPPPVSPTISIPPVEVLAEMESASDNVGNGSSK